MPKKFSLGSAIAIAGIISVAAGAWLLAPALGLIVVGAAVIYVGYRMGG